MGSIYQQNQQLFRDKVKEANPDIEVMGKYINSKLKIKAKCLKCGNIKEILPSNLLKPSGCRYCNNGKRTHEQFVEELAKVDDSIEVLDKYTGSSSLVLVRCKKCGREWEVIARLLLRGRGCFNCKSCKGGRPKKSDV